MTDKQELFCKEYIIDFNASRAYSIAYNREKDDSTRAMGCELLTNINIQVEINKELDKRKERVEVKQDRIIHELAKIAFADITNYLSEDGQSFDVNKIKEIDGSIISSIDFDKKTINSEKKGYEVVNNKIKVKLNDKLKALELLGKHLKIFNENIDLNINNKKDIKEILDNNQATEKEINDAYQQMIKDDK